MQPHPIAIIALSVGALLLPLMIFLSIRARRQQRLIDNVPTSKTAGVFIGLVEVKGTAEAEDPLISYLAEGYCVYYSYSIAEHWRRTVTETYTDSDGKTKTRTKTESGWSTVDSGGYQIPFYLRDDSGILLVRPDGAKIEGTVVFSETCGRSDPLYYGKGPSHSVSNSTHRRRFTEYAIPLHDQVYVIGRARERQDIVAAEIAADNDAPIYLISTRSEEQISRSHAWGFWLWFIFGMIIAGGGGWGLSAVIGGGGRFSIWPIPVVAGGYFFAWLTCWAWMVYNSTIDLKNRVDRAWSLIDVELKRRSELIPRLVNVVSAFKDYEARLQTELATLRNQVGASPPGVAGADPRACKPALIAIAENYPELKGNELYQKLHHQLVETEQRIALSRGYFNDIATQHNIRLEVIPDCYFASLAGLRRRELMAAADFERAAVVVNLSN